MDKSLLKKAAMQSVALMLAVMTLSYAIKNYQTVTSAASSLQNIGTATVEATTDDNNKLVTLEHISNDQSVQIPNVSSEEAVTTPINSVESLKSRMNEDIKQKLGDHFLVIKKPQGTNLSMQLEDLYVKHSIQLNITGITENKLNQDMILRVREDELFVGEPKYEEVKTLEIDDEEGTTEEVVTKDFGDDFCHGITINSLQDSTGQYSTQLLLELDNVYAYITYEDKDYYYIDLKRPHDVYDKIIVIDAGHGGKDAGALSKNSKIYEKNINVGIIQQLKELLDKQDDIKVYYTRTGDETVFLRPRVTLANSVDCDYFISVHCNANEVTSPNGTEVLYYDTDFKGVKSSQLATMFSDELAKIISLKQKGIIKKQLEDIFILDKSLVPSILIEVGYMTNRSDLDYLTQEENQKKVAQGIYNSIIKAYNDLPTTK